jgi:predicted site-specific integrase-resolvase
MTSDEADPDLPSARLKPSAAAVAHARALLAEIDRRVFAGRRVSEAAQREDLARSVTGLFGDE